MIEMRKVRAKNATGEMDVRIKANNEFFESPDDTAVVVSIHRLCEFLAEGVAELTLDQAEELKSLLGKAIEHATECRRATLTAE